MKKPVLVEYLVSLLVAVLLTAGFYAAESALSGSSGAGTVNVALAVATFFLLGGVLLLGPLSRLFDVFDRLLRFRRELGMASFLTAVTHVYLVMFPLAHNGPWGLYRYSPWSAYPGLEALLIMFVLFVLSWNPMMHAMGTKLWWQIQYWGARIAFVLVGVHMIVLRREIILSWFAPSLLPAGSSSAAGVPPLIIWEMEFLFLVLLIRLSELFGAKAARVITQVASVFIAVVMIWVVVRGTMM